MSFIFLKLFFPSRNSSIHLLICFKKKKLFICHKLGEVGDRVKFIWYSTCHILISQAVKPFAFWSASWLARIYFSLGVLRISLIYLLSSNFLSSKSQIKPINLLQEFLSNPIGFKKKAKTFLSNKQRSLQKEPSSCFATPELISLSLTLWAIKDEASTTFIF